MPTGGLDFGSAVNAQAILDQPSQFDFYDGGGLDAAFLGMAQVDQRGDVNVSRFGSKLAGSGGFINISQNAKRVVFLGTFVTPSRCQVRDGRLVIADGVTARKFLADVEQRTFSGEYAVTTGQPVLYVTERCVFELTPDGLELIEIAPGVRLETDILAHVGFDPIIRGEPKLMDARIFAAEPMGLSDDLLTMPLDARFVYDAERNIFFLSMEGLSLVNHDDVEAIVAEVDKRLTAIGKKVQMVVNYDNFFLAPDLADEYVALGARAGRALLRQRDQVHDQLLPTAQAQRAAVPSGTGPTHLQEPSGSNELRRQLDSGGTATCPPTHLPRSLPWRSSNVRRTCSPTRRRSHTATAG